MDALDIVVGIVGCVASVVAIWQFIEARRRMLRERERLGIHASRNEVALRSAILGAQMADVIVQRAKDPDVTVAELQNLGRVARGALLSLTLELEEQAKVLEAWRIGRHMLHSEPPHPAGETKDLTLES